MIRLKLRQLEGEWKEINIQNETTLDRAVEKILVSERLPNTEEFFTVVVDGLVVEREMWSFTKVSRDTRVEIYPKVQGGNFGQVFKTIFVTAVMVAVTYFTAGLGAPVAAGLGALAGIGASLAINALIPMPKIGGGNAASEERESQVYTISSQANTIDKYGVVPKVYGKHRIFPRIVANPYTEIEVDPATKELVQYYYAIFDFGHGPSTIANIKIGETPITEFSDVSYNLVDINRPDVDEGDWDTGILKDFQFYKGDVHIENIGANLNENENSGTTNVDGYRLVRNTYINPNNYESEITVTLVNPQGLIAYGSDGSTHVRTIDMRVEFRKVGTTTWYPYNDIQKVKEYSAVGGVNQSFKGRASTPTEDANPLPSKFFVSATSGPVKVRQEVTAEINGEIKTRYYYTDRIVETVGVRAGVTELVVASTLVNGTVAEYPVGASVFIGGRYLGQIKTVEDVADKFLYRKKITFVNPTTIDIPNYVQRVKDAELTYAGGITGYKYFWTGNDGLEMEVRTPATNISRKSKTAAYSQIRFTPVERGQFEVRITRRSSTSAATHQVIDALSVQTITTRLADEPIKSKFRHTFLELRIKATNQLNGSVDNLSAIAQSVLPVYKNGNWELEPTSNPAWVYCDILTGKINKRAVGKDRLDMPSIVEWAEFCDVVPTTTTEIGYSDKRFETNFILDYSSTVQDLANQVANACQASMNIVNGKYGVLLDTKKTVPVQVFTPRNSSNFSSQRAYSIPPHALKVSYIDPSQNWIEDEVVVYQDGYDYESAETFEEVSTFACTSVEQAWRYGRYMMAQARFRQETISITVDFEYLICTRGDYVRVSQDVMKVGGIPARVIEVTGNEIKIDNALEISSLVTLGYLVRRYDGIFNGGATILSSDRLLVNGTVPRVGDLVVIGELEKVWFDCLVKSINPLDDLSATLILVEKADLIYDYENGADFGEYDPQITELPTDERPAKVTDLEITENSWLCGANSFEYYMKLEWEVPAQTAYEYFQVYVDGGRGFNLVAETKEAFYTYYVNADDVDNLHRFKVVAVSVSGKAINLIEADELTEYPAKNLVRPSNIARLSTNITGEVLQLDWEATRDCIREYLIRYSPDLNGTWEQSIPLLRADKNTTMASTQARTGVYLIKAINFDDIESATATRAITTIPELFNLNVVEETTDWPDLAGAKVRTKSVGDTLLLRTKNEGGVTDNEFYSDGYYYYKKFLDLGEIYTVRLQSYIRAEGYTIGDIMSNWNTLAEVEALARSRYSEWDVETEYRATDAQNIMAEWPNMAVVDPISEGYQENWTPWRKFTVNDATGRLIQFRLKLVSNKASVSPRVFDGLIKADMPDRVESWPNLVTELDGSCVVQYNPPFKGPNTTPSIQISIDNAQSGDYYEFEYKNLDGFKIIFYDRTDLPVQRTFDAQVKGYGRKANSIM